MRCFGSRLVAVWLAIVLLLCTFSASAGQDKQLVKRDQGMEAHLFRSAVDTKGHFTVDATPVLPHLAISLGLMLDFGFNDWVAVEQDRQDDSGFYRPARASTTTSTRC